MLSENYKIKFLLKSAVDQISAPDIDYDSVWLFLTIDVYEMYLSLPSKKMFEPMSE